MTKCIGCRSCEVACNEQNNTPADLRWRRIGEIEGGTYPNTDRFYLSMGCNHCLSADCIKGCPVDAYTKDPVTGIVLHSADACIGCQYCVWNCPYSVPQFNPERGVVGKCDMCHGRLTDGLEPACVNACPEYAIEIEIVNQLEWRSDHAAGNAPGMPNAGVTISTTRITLPENAYATLERVDIETLRPEHPHWSLVWMTSLIQLSAGTLVAALLSHHDGPIALTLFWSSLHSRSTSPSFTSAVPPMRGEPQDVASLLALPRSSPLRPLLRRHSSALTAVSWLSTLHLDPKIALVLLALKVIAPTLGLAGILASAYIYLVPARPAWNTPHTPIDFILSAAVLGSAAAPVLISATTSIRSFHAFASSSSTQSFPLWPLVLFSTLWCLNLVVRTIRLHHASVYERRAAASLLNTPELRGIFLVSFAFIGLAILLSLAGMPTLALPAALAGVISARYLFFVSVVPLNMALTFVRSVHA